MKRKHLTVHKRHRFYVKPSYLNHLKSKISVLNSWSLLSFDKYLQSIMLDGLPNSEHLFRNRIEVSSSTRKTVPHSWSQNSRTTPLQTRTVCRFRLYLFRLRWVFLGDSEIHFGSLTNLLRRYRVDRGFPTIIARVMMTEIYCLKTDVSLFSSKVLGNSTSRVT